MKHILPVLAAFVVVASCETQSQGGQKIDGEKIVLDYLHNHTNGIEYTIIEISEPDSLYCPAELLSSLMIRKSERYSELTKQLAEAYNKSSLKERKTAAKEVAKLAYEEYHNHEGTDDIVHSLNDKYFDARTANRLGYRVKYKVDGQLTEDVFYVERTGENQGKAIGITASELLASYHQYIKINNQFYSLKEDAELAAKTMR